MKTTGLEHVTGEEGDTTRAVVDSDSQSGKRDWAADSVKEDRVIGLVVGS